MPVSLFVSLIQVGVKIAVKKMPGRQCIKIVNSSGLLSQGPGTSLGHLCT